MRSCLIHDEGEHPAGQNSEEQSCSRTKHKQLECAPQRRPQYFRRTGRRDPFGCSGHEAQRHGGPGLAEPYDPQLVKRLCISIALENDLAESERLKNLLHVVMQEDREEVRLRLKLLKKLKVEGGAS